MTDNVKGLRAARVADTEERILVAARTLFLRDGYAATTLAAVADAARVGHRTVYVRFGTKAALEALAERLTALGEQHAGVHFATIGWILPHSHDPDGHEIRFYTTEHHTDPDDAEIKQVHDPVATAAARERAYLAAHREA